MSAKETRRRNLGRGLDALLGGDAAGTAADSGAADHAGARVASENALPIERLHPGRFQPRKTFDADELAALAASIRENGILQPILVRPHPNRAGDYEIIAGERRWRAGQDARLHEVPVVVRELTDQQSLEIALVENLQRQDLTPLEEAEGYKRLIDEFQHTQEVLAKTLGKSRSHIANMIRLLSLPDAVKKLMAKGDLSAGQGRAILNARDPSDLARQIVQRGLNVRQTEALVRAERKPTAKRPGKRGPTAGGIKNPDTVALERRLSEALGFRILINELGDGGEVIIRYASLEQLDDIIERLQS